MSTSRSSRYLVVFIGLFHAWSQAAGGNADNCIAEEEPFSSLQVASIFERRHFSVHSLAPEKDRHNGPLADSAAWSSLSLLLQWSYLQSIYPMVIVIMIILFCASGIILVQFHTYDPARNQKEDEQFIRNFAYEAADTQNVEDDERPSQPKPKGGFWVEGFRQFSLELVGSFIANLLILGVICTSANATSNASILQTATPSAGAATVPPLVPDARGSNGTGTSISPPPTDQVLIAIGASLSIAMGLIVAPGATLSPSFTFTVACFMKSERPKLVFALLGQMLGGFVACWVMYALEGQILSDHGVHGTSLVPKTVESAALYGVSIPKENISLASRFFSTMIFMMLMVFTIVPAVAGEGMKPTIKALLVAAIIAPFVVAQGSFGVQTNAAMYISGLIFTTMAGWPLDLWRASNYYVVCVAVAPIIGGLLGGLVLLSWTWLLNDPASPCVWKEKQQESQPEVSVD